MDSQGIANPQHLHPSDSGRPTHEENEGGACKLDLIVGASGGANPDDDAEPTRMHTTAHGLALLALPPCAVSGGSDACRPAPKATPVAAAPLGVMSFASGSFSQRLRRRSLSLGGRPLTAGGG